MGKAVEKTWLHFKSIKEDHSMTREEYEAK